MSCRNTNSVNVQALKRIAGSSGDARSRTQRGAALVVALLVVALATVMAVSIASEFLLTLRRSGNAMLVEQEL